MARNITLTLGAALGADLGPNFNLTANVGSVTPSTATRIELLAGKSVSVDDLATQVTITSTGTCTNAATQTIPCAGGPTTTTTTSPPETALYVYVKDEGGANLILYAGINGAPGIDIWDEAIDGPLSSVCGLIYTFSGGIVVPGDTVTFSTNINCIMDGNNTASCPPASGTNTTFTTATLISGNNYVALGMDSSYSP